MMRMESTTTYRVDRAEVLRYLGYAGQEIDSTLDARLDAIIARCEQVSNPGFVYRVFPVDASRGDIRLVGTTMVLPGGDIFAHLGAAKMCAVMAATAGLANERELRRVSLLNSLDGMMFDAAGSALAEVVADACNARIVAEAKARGLFTNWRYSPGYGDLPLDLQPQVIRVLAADKKLGVTATDSNLLIPAKSVTAFVGFFDTPQETTRTCATCSFAQYCDLKKKGSPCYR